MLQHHTLADFGSSLSHITTLHRLPVTLVEGERV